MFCQLLVSVLLLAPSPSLVEDKIDGKLLIGKWEAEKPPEGADKVVVEYLKEGKLSVEVEAQGQKLKFEGTYTLEGNKLNVKVDFNGNVQDQKRIVVKLTDSELVTSDDEKMERKYKKVK